MSFSGKGLRGRLEPVVGVATLALVLAIAVDARAQTPAHWTLAPIRTSVLAGKTFTADLSVEIDEGWHVYGLTTPAGGPRALEISVAKASRFVIAGAIGASEPTTAFDPNFNMETRFHEDRASFHVPLLMNPGAVTGPLILTIELSYQVCNSRLCLPPTEEEVSTALGKEGAAAVARPASQEPVAPGTVSPRRQSSAPSSVRVIDMSVSSSTAPSLMAYVSVAALMGALSVLTPCVFPMVPITISYFMRRSASGARHALIYGLAIVLTFTAIGFPLAIGFGASGLNYLAANPWLNLGVAALFLGFALSLLGILELRLPSRVLTSASNAGRAQGGAGETLFMGLAFTLTSFTCTAPFLGTLLVVTSERDWLWPLAGLLAFSTAFALPFIVLAYVPQAIAALPRSGPWLVALKVTMGLVEVAASIKFLSNADLVWNWHVFTRQVVLMGWITIVAVFLAYLMGAVPIGPMPRLARPGASRAILGVATVAFGIWLGTGLSGRGLGELEAFLPPADLAGASAKGELPWIVNDYDAALAQARATNRAVLIDFTGYTCTNCRWMEANLFPRPEIARELARYVRVRLYTDGRGAMYQRYQTFERVRFGTVALPYYAALAPDGRATVVFAGLTREPGQFIALLKRGLE